MPIHIAFDEHKNRISIEDVPQDIEKRHEHSYICPLCRKKLIPRKGELRRHHYAHESGERDCDSWADNSMSDWHLGWQEAFPKEMREFVFPDKDEDGKGHRADITVDGGKTIIEFQYSPMTHKMFARRSRFYTKNARTCVWVFDCRSKVGKSLSYKENADGHVSGEWKNLPSWARKQGGYPLDPAVLSAAGVEIFLAVEGGEAGADGKLIWIKQLDRTGTHCFSGTIIEAADFIAKMKDNKLIQTSLHNKLYTGKALAVGGQLKLPAVLAYDSLEHVPISMQYKQGTHIEKWKEIRAADTGCLRFLNPEMQVAEPVEWEILSVHPREVASSLEGTLPILDVKLMHNEHTASLVAILSPENSWDLEDVTAKLCSEEKSILWIPGTSPEDICKAQWLWNKSVEKMAIKHLHLVYLIHDLGLGKRNRELENEIARELEHAPTDAVAPSSVSRLGSRLVSKNVKLRVVERDGEAADVRGTIQLLADPGKPAVGLSLEDGDELLGQITEMINKSYDDSIETLRKLNPVAVKHRSSFPLKVILSSYPGLDEISMRLLNEQEEKELSFTPWGGTIQAESSGEYKKKLLEKVLAKEQNDVRGRRAYLVSEKDGEAEIALVKAMESDLAVLREGGVGTPALDEWEKDFLVFSAQNSRRCRFADAEKSNHQGFVRWQDGTVRIGLDNKCMKQVDASVIWTAAKLRNENEWMYSRHSITEEDGEQVVEEKAISLMVEQLEEVYRKVLGLLQYDIPFELEMDADASVATQAIVEDMQYVARNGNVPSPSAVSSLTWTAWSGRCCEDELFADE